MSRASRPRRSTSLLLPRAARLAARAAVVLATVGAASACGRSGEERAAAAAPATTGATAGAPAPDTATARLTSAAAGETTAVAEGMPADSSAQRAAADSGRILGAPTAKVWMLMISDFECPFCKRWHDASFAALKREYVDAGKVRMAYVHFPLDQHVQAMPSAEASMCASAQRRFWEFQGALFEDVEAWAKAGDQSATYEAIAKRVGVADAARFRSCLRSHVMRAVIEADKDRMVRVGVQSTPSFFVGQKGIAGALPLPVFRAALDSAVAAAGAAR